MYGIRNESLTICIVRKNNYGNAWKQDEEKKGMARGGKMGMKKKGYAKGGMKKKGYAAGGTMKKKGKSKGGAQMTLPKAVKRNQMALYKNE